MSLTKDGQLYAIYYGEGSVMCHFFEVIPGPMPHQLCINGVRTQGLLSMIEDFRLNFSYKVKHFGEDQSSA